MLPSQQLRPRPDQRCTPQSLPKLTPIHPPLRHLQGVLVLDVQPGGAAASAGLRPTVRDNLGRLILGDVITSLDGRTVHTYEDLFEILDSKRVGDTISVGLQRGGKEVMLALKLQPRMLGQAE